MLAELKDLPGSPDDAPGPEWSAVRVVGTTQFVPPRLWWASRLEQQKAAETHKDRARSQVSRTSCIAEAVWRDG